MTDEDDEPETQQAYVPGVPVCWRTLNRDEKRNHLQELERWLTWLKRRYALDRRVLPPCWAEHGALVEELSALHTAWGVAYAVATAPDVPLRWHAEFASARQRLAEWVARSGCRPGEHRADNQRQPCTPGLELAPGT